MSKKGVAGAPAVAVYALPKLSAPLSRAELQSGWKLLGSLLAGVDKEEVQHAKVQPWAEKRQ